MPDGSGRGSLILVWDWPVRAFHWLLVAAVAVAAVTGFILGRTFLAIHLIAGAALAVLIAARIVWGFLGPAHARFADFAYAPRLVMAHVRDLRAGRAARHLGHNPLGALMVFALLLVLAALVATGTVALGGMLKQGPLAPFLSYATGRAWYSLHQPLAWLLLAMIAAHLGGVAFESLRTRENLARAMLTGRKRGPDEPVRWRGHLAAGVALSLLLVGGGAGAVAALSALPARGVPPATLDPAYDGACGSCHFTFSPSLNPAWVWNRIMDGLGHHFGVRATLAPADAAQVRAYLDANSAEHWDTLAANVFRVRDPAQPLRITATPFWRRRHAAIPASVFQQRNVSGKLSCAACHADAASGRFAPQAVRIPAPGA